MLRIKIMNKKIIASLIFALSLGTTLNAQTLGTTTRIPEGTCTTGAAGIDTLCADSVDHALSISNNAGSRLNIPQTFYLTTTFTNATATFANVTGLAFPVGANRNYHAVCHITWQGSTSLAAPKYQFTGPSGSTASVAMLQSSGNVSNFVTQTATTYATSLANTFASIVPLFNFTDTIEFSVLNGSTAGTVQLQAALVTSGQLTIQPASACLVQ